MPSSKAVNRPTIKDVKEQDIANKLQLYGIYSAFAIGKVPSNKQIDIALNSVLESSILKDPPAALSNDGKKLVADVRDVIEQAKLLALSKNSGEILQKFIWETQQISGGQTSLPGAPVDKDTARQHGNKVLEDLRILGQLMITNGQFRKLLKDVATLFRSMAGDAASKAATKVQPSEEQLRSIDEPALDNTWHDAPNLSKDNLKSQAARYKPFNKQDLKETAGDASQAAHPGGSRDPADVVALAQREHQAGGHTGIDIQSGINTAANKLNQKVEENSPETKNKAKEYNTRAKNYLSSKMPKERRENTIWRLKKMVIEIQGHSDCKQYTPARKKLLTQVDQRAIDTLLRLAEEYTGHTKSIAVDSKGTVKGAHTDNSLKSAEANLKVPLAFRDSSKPALTSMKTLLERFANGTSMDDFIDSVNQIYRDADKDPELKSYFKELDRHIRKCLQEQGYILQQQCNNDFNALYDKGTYLLRNKYKSHTDRILNEIKFFGLQFDEDAQNKAFADAITNLFLDLGNDESGKTVFKPHLLKDITEVILPRVLEQTSYVPLPRMEYSDSQVDIIIENLIVESDNLAPNVLEFETDNHWKWGRKSGGTSYNKNKVTLAVSGVQMDLRDVSFYINRKQGFPSLKDQGLCDILMGGEGFSFKLKMETADAKDQSHFFKISSVQVKVANLNIKLKKSKHKLLFALGKPLLLQIMRPALQKVLQSAIKQKARQLDGIIFEIYTEAHKAKKQAEANPDIENIQNIYQRYWTAANQRMTQAKQKKKEVEASMDDKKFQMAMTKHDSLFPNIDLPSGISTKATEYRDLAHKGEEWESPVFSIGTAKESTNIPKAPEIVRKHNRAPVNISDATYQDHLRMQGHGQGYGGSTYGNNVHPSLGVTSSIPENSNGISGLSSPGAGNKQYGEVIQNRQYDPATATGRVFDPASV